MSNLKTHTRTHAQKSAGGSAAEAPGEAFGAARLEVRPVRAWAPESATFSALEQWREARVSVRGAEFEPSRLTQDRITYGPNPWQRLQPEGMRMGGRELPLLFMHPVSSATVSATWPIPSGVRRGRTCTLITKVEPTRPSPSRRRQA